MKIKVAAAQMGCRIGDKQSNLKKAVDFIKEAQNLGVKIVCLPEMFNSGYFCHVSHLDLQYLNLAEPIDGPTINTLRDYSVKFDMALIAPIVEKGSDAFYNTAVAIDSNGEIAGCYRKVHLPWSHTGWEKFFFRQGYNFPVFVLSGVKVGIMICYDREFPEAARSLTLNSAEIIFVPSGFSIANLQAWKFVLQTRAYENQVFLVGVSLTGKVDDEHYEFGGHSVIISPRGEVIAGLELEEGLLAEEIDLEQIIYARKQRFMLRDRRPEVYNAVTEKK